MDIKQVCKNCKLYDPQTHICGVVVPLTESMKAELGVDVDRIQLKPSPNDSCFYMQEFKAINKETMDVERFNVEIQQIRMWVEDKDGNKAKDGTVKIEYPADSYLAALMEMDKH